MRERLYSPTCQGGVERLDWKDTILCLQPHQIVIIPWKDGKIMQPPKKDFSFLQLPLIQLSKEPRAPTASFLDINHPSIFWRGYKIKFQEWIPQKVYPRTTYSFKISPYPQNQP